MAETTNGPRGYTLLEPVKITRKAVGSGAETEDTISVLNFRKPKGADFRALDNAKGEIAKAMAFGAQIADVPVMVFDKLDSDDYAAVMDIVGSFLQKSLQT